MRVRRPRRAGQGLGAALRRDLPRRADARPRRARARAGAAPLRRAAPARVRQRVRQRRRRRVRAARADYLRKPVSRRRVEEALERVAAAVERRRTATAATASARGRGSRAGRATRWSPSPTPAAASTRLVARSSILYVAVPRRLRPDRDRRRPLPAARDAGRDRAALGAVRLRPRAPPVRRQPARAVELRPLLGGTAELAFGDGQTIPIARRHVAELGRRLGV